MSGRGFGKGRRGRPQRVGGPAHCICPKCSYKVLHVRGTPCLTYKCPKCGAFMMPSS